MLRAAPHFAVKKLRLYVDTAYGQPGILSVGGVCERKS